MIFVFFFFKQKTAYEMRISDWSSDVCSSDLVRQPCQFQFGHYLLLAAPGRENEILVDDQPNGRAGADRDRGLDVEIARRELIAGAGHVLLGRFPDRLNEVALTGNRQLRPPPEQRGKRDRTRVG